jgi:hypothetical protein
MKITKLIAISILMLIAINLSAQIKVNSAANVGIGSDPISNYKTYIYYPSEANDARGLYVKLLYPIVYPQRQFAIQGTITSGTGIATGIYGAAINSTPSSSTSIAYGVYGKVRNAKNGFNYGIFGHLYGNNNGAAIFGAVDNRQEINTEGKYAGYFRGDVYVEYELWADELTESDIRIKKDIIDIDSSLSKILEIKGQKYNLRLPSEIKEETNNSDTGDYNAFDYSKFQKYQKEHYGIIAQDLQKVFPDLVYESQNGTLGILYDGLIPIIIEAIKEQQAQIETLKAEIYSLKNKDSKTKSTADNYFNNNSELFQNQPNPFSENTYINYFISDEINKATIYIYDLQGRQVKAISISERGYGSSVIYGSELYAGTYHYTLITDGQIIGTYTMILTN